MRSAAGNMQVAATAVGFTTLFFVIVVLAGALMLGYGGRRSEGTRKSSSRGGRTTRAERQPRGGDSRGQSRGGFTAGGKFGVSHHRDMMTIEVNPNKCARYGFCEHEAPEVFYLESDGRFGYESEVPVSQMEEVVTAMDVCPRRAIKVKLPPGVDPLAKPEPAFLPDDSRRTIVPIFGDAEPGGELPQRPRRA